MENKRNAFQTIILIIFGVAAVAAVAMFATNGGGGSNSGQGAGLGGQVEIWGTLDQNLMGQGIGAIAGDFKNVEIRYQQIESEEFESQFVNALASGQGPDLIMIEGQDVVRQRDRLQPMSFDMFPQNLFAQTYIDSAQIFILDDGVYGFPLLIDPLILYYNKDILTSYFYLGPPTTWDEVIDVATKVTTRTDSGTITRSGVALGTSKNIKHAKDIWATLVMQSGNPITVRTLKENDFDPGFASVVKENGAQGQELPAARGLAFYTTFADRAQGHYSWNQSMALDQDAFVAGDAAVYFGFASEYRDIAARNPNLNYGIAMMPQVQDAFARNTFGRVYGVAMTRTTDNPQAALAIGNALATQVGATALVESFALAPARRDILGSSVQSVALNTIFQSAIIARTWFTPDAAATSVFINQMIIDVNSGREQPGRLITFFDNQLQDLFQ